MNWAEIFATLIDNNKENNLDHFVDLLVNVLRRADFCRQK